MTVGRPTSYTDEIAELVCYQISRGESLRHICADEGLPTRETVLNWLVSRADFFSKYARARLAQAEVMDERILQTAEDCLAGKIDPHAAKVAIGAYQWRASKLSPKVYGDAMQLRHADADGNPLKVEVTRVSPRKPRVIDVTPTPAALPPPDDPADE